LSSLRSILDRLLCAGGVVFSKNNISSGRNFLGVAHRHEIHLPRRILYFENIVAITPDILA